MSTEKHKIFENNKEILLSENSIVFSNVKDSLIEQDKENLVPVHIAHTGIFSGYRDGEFSLTSDIFKECILNFNAEKTPLPIYRGHWDAVGTPNGSEPPNDGWILALTMPNENNLWALCEFTNDLKKDIEAGRYKFSSIYMKTNEVHRVSGEEIGCRLISLAITSQPFLDSLEAITLSNTDIKSSTANIYLSNKANQMKSKKMLTNKDVACADGEVINPTEQMDAMQDGKVMEQPTKDPLTMLEEARVAISPDASIEEFVTKLIQMLQAEVTEEKVESEMDTQMMEEATLAETEEVSKEQVEEEKVKEVAASAILSNTVKALNLQLSNANKEISSLKKELKQRDEVLLTAIVDDAIAQGKLTYVEKSSFIKLGSVDRTLFDELLAARNHKPSVVLGRVSFDSSKDSQKTVDDRIKKLSAHELEILRGAKIKL